MTHSTGEYPTPEQNPTSDQYAVATGSFATPAPGSASAAPWAPPANSVTYGTPPATSAYGQTNAPIIMSWVYAGICTLVGLILILTNNASNLYYGNASSAIATTVIFIIGVAVMAVGLIGISISLAATAVVGAIKRKN